MRKYYTYCLISSITNTPFYVGKGVSSRMYHHKRDAANPNYNHRSVHRKIQSIIKKGGEILYERVEHPTESIAFESEIMLIEKYGRKDLGTGILCNLTDGGEGANNISEESIKSRAEKHRGMKRSEESKKYMSQIQKEMADERREIYGKACSPETSKRMSDSRKGKEWSEAARKVNRNKPTAKVVLAYKKDDNSFVGEYESISECGRKLNCDVTAVWYICEGTPCKRGGKKGKLYPLRSCKGYKFQYKN